MRLKALLGAAALCIAGVAGAVLASPANAQGNCYTTSGFVAPDLLRCQAVGQDNLGRTIWMCCN